MRQQLRRTGISILGDVPWGAHICLFYETRDDLIETLVPFFKAGLESNEFCIWAVTDPLTVEDASATLAAGIPDFARHLSDGRIELVRGHDWYMSRDLKKVTDGWLAMKDTALARGFAGMRASGNAFWLETEFRDDFLAYEQELDAAISGCPMLVLCTYSLVQSRAADLYEVARAHGITAARRKGHWEIVEALTDLDTHSLTLREVEVLTWVARGKSAWEIGQILGIVKRTVDEHAGSAMRKLGAANRTEAIAIAMHRRIIELDRTPGPARQFRHAQ
jgi:DNA-binding CsgD family transcriptional regulator